MPSDGERDICPVKQDRVGSAKISRGPHETRTVYGRPGQLIETVLPTPLNLDKFTIGPSYNEALKLRRPLTVTAVASVLRGVMRLQSLIKLTTMGDCPKAERLEWRTQ